MKKLTELNFQDLINYINKINYKDENYKKHTLYVKDSLGRTYSSKIDFFDTKKNPIIERMVLSTSHDKFDHISTLFTYDKKNKVQRCYVSIYKNGNTIFRKEIKRGKLLLLEALINKVKLEDKRLAQRERKQEERAYKSLLVEAQNIYI